MTLDPPSTGTGASPLGVALAHLLDEAAAARCRRRLEQLARQSSAAKAGRAAEIGDVARSAYAIVELERLADGPAGDRVALCPLLTRLATLVQLAASGGSEMVSGLATASAPGGVARCLIVALLELLHVIETTSSLDRRPRLFLASTVEGELFVTALGGVAELAVPAGAAARSLERAARIVRLLGGDVVRGLDGDMHIIVVTLPLADDHAAIGEA